MQSAYCSRFQKIKNLYKKLSFSNYYFEEINFIVVFYFPRRTSIGAICLLQSLPKNQEFVQKISFSNYFEEINFNVFFYFPRRTSIGAICLLQSLPKNQEFEQKISFSNYYFEEINCNVFFYFPRRTSIGAICLLQSLPKNQEFVQQNLFLTTTLRKSILMCFSIFPGGRQ